MIRFYTLVLGAAIALWGPYSVAQNLIPNPGFESHSNCPNNVAQFLGYVDTWQQANTASPDYTACGYTGNSAIRTVAANGNASVGMWGGAGHPSCPGSAYAEGVRTNLAGTMEIGKNYHLQFRVRVDPTGTSTLAPNNCVDFGMYFYNSATPPPMTGWCCNPVTPQWKISGNLIPEGPYAVFDQVIPGGGWDAVIIGPFCNGNTASAPCTNYNFSRMYFNLDDIEVEEIIILDQGNLTLEGKAYPAFNALSWNVEKGHPYDRFVLERSLDGQTFTTVEEQYADDATIPKYQYRDMTPATGANFYRLTGVTREGEKYLSEVVELLHGENALQGGALSYAYDMGGNELRIPLEGALADNYSLQVIDMQGRVIAQNEWQMEAGNEELTMPVRDIAQGMYLLRLHARSQNLDWSTKWLR